MCKNWDDICIRPRLCDPSSFTKKGVRKKELTRWSEIGMEFCGGSAKLPRTKKCTLPPFSIIVGKVFSLIAYIIMTFPCRSDNIFTKLIFIQEIDIQAWTFHLRRNNLSWRIWSYKHPWIFHQCWQSETCCTGIRCHVWDKVGKKSWQKNRHWKQQWRWKLHINCREDGVLMLLLRRWRFFFFFLVSLCVCVWAFFGCRWPDYRFVCPARHTHTIYRSITGCARFPTRRLRRFQNLPSVGARETDLAFLEISSNGSFHLPRLPGLNGDDYNVDDHCIGKTNKTKKIPTAFFIIASDFVFSGLISSGFSSYRFESSAQRRTSHLHGLDNEEVARRFCILCIHTIALFVVLQRKQAKKASVGKWRE